MAEPFLSRSLAWGPDHLSLALAFGWTPGDIDGLTATEIAWWAREAGAVVRKRLTLQTI